jgi:hypothetical protein
VAGTPSITVSEPLPHTSMYACEVLVGMITQPYTRWVDVTKKTVPYYCMDNLKGDKICLTPIDAYCVEEYEH